MPDNRIDKPHLDPPTLLINSSATWLSENNGGIIGINFLALTRTISVFDIGTRTNEKI